MRDRYGESAWGVCGIWQSGEWQSGTCSVHVGGTGNLMATDLRESKVLLTGGAGLLGSLQVTWRAASPWQGPQQGQLGSTTTFTLVLL